MQNLPRDLDYYLLADVPLEELYHLCQTNKKYRAICQEENMWRIRYARDYPNKKLATGTYRDFYLSPIKIFFNKRHIETIRVMNNQVTNLSPTSVIKYVTQNKLTQARPVYLIILNDNNKNINSIITIENKYNQSGDKIISSGTNHIIVDSDVSITQINILTTPNIVGFISTNPYGIPSYDNILEQTRNIITRRLESDTLNNIFNKEIFNDYLDIINSEYHMDLDEFLNNTTFQFREIPPNIIISKSGHVVATTDHIYQGNNIDSHDIFVFLERYIVILNKLKSFI